MRLAAILFSLGCALSGGVIDANAAASPSQWNFPDLIIHNAKIVTVDDRFSIAQAAAIRGGRFVAVGSNEDILQWAGPKTGKVDLAGRTVLPGFIDTNLKLVNRAIDWVSLVDLTNVKSIADIQKALAARMKVAAAGEWILGSRGWWEYELAEGRLPTRHDLDTVTPKNPVCIPGPHYEICNSLALKIGGVSRETVDPPAGQIWRDETGEPTGLLMDAARKHVHPYFQATRDRQKMLDGIRELIATVNSFGTTSYRELGGSKEQVELLRELYTKGQLTVRVDWVYHIDPATPEDRLDSVLEALGPPGQSFGDGLFRADGIGEVTLDGGEQTALLRSDYPGRPGYRGNQYVSQEQFNKVAAAAARHGWRPAPHAVGDGAIDQVLTAYEYANVRTPLTNRRWMMEHAWLLQPDHYDRVKKLGLIINSQYTHNYQLGALILKAWQRPLADMSQRYRDWADNGIVFTLGCDGPISYTANPLHYIYGAVTRNTTWGGRLGPEQGLTREEAIRAVTSTPALISFEEHVKGSIEVGKYADFSVLSDDILTVPALRIKDIKVLATSLGGKVVYGVLE